MQIYRELFIRLDAWLLEFWNAGIFAKVFLAVGIFGVAFLAYQGIFVFFNCLAFFASIFPKIF